MNRFLFTLFVAVVFVVPVMAQNTLITGNAPGAEGKTIRWFRYADLLTFREEQVASAVIDSSGEFSLTADPAETRYIAIEIDFHRTEFFVEPGKSYRLKVAEMDYNQAQEINPFISSQSLQADIINPGLNELNIWIQNYNAKYDQFLLDHFNQLYLERNRSLVDTFRLSINRMFSDVNILYYQDYMTYKTAGLEQLSRALNQYQLARKYFIDKPILYQNMEYMNFFNSYFTKYVTATSNVLRKADLTAIINGPQAFKVLLKTAAGDSILRNEPLRELVLLKGLLEIFYSNINLQDRVIEVVREAETECKSPENKLVAKDLFLRLSRLRPGTAAPGFTLDDRNKKAVSLKEMKGKPVVLCFWTTYCQGCLSEMEMMAGLWPKYKDKVEFVNISADKDYVMMKFFIDRKPAYTWKFLHVGQNWELLKDYDVRSYPLFVAIDRQGNIFRQFPAPTPSEGLEKLLDELSAQ
jgi:peroxiredoxin